MSTVKRVLMGLFEGTICVLLGIPLAVLIMIPQPSLDTGIHRLPPLDTPIEYNEVGHYLVKEQVRKCAPPAPPLPVTTTRAQKPPARIIVLPPLPLPAKKVDDGQKPINFLNGCHQKDGKQHNHNNEMAKDHKTWTK